MHVAMVVVFGLVALAVFYFGAGLFQRSGATGAAAIGVAASCPTLTALLSQSATSCSILTRLC